MALVLASERARARARASAGGTRSAAAAAPPPSRLSSRGPPPASRTPRGVACVRHRAPAVASNRRPRRPSDPPPLSPGADPSHRPPLQTPPRFVLVTVGSVTRSVPSTNRAPALARRRRRCRAASCLFGEGALSPGRRRPPPARGRPLRGDGRSRCARRRKGARPSLGYGGGCGKGVASDLHARERGAPRAPRGAARHSG